MDGILDQYGEVSFEYIDELEQEKSRLKAEAEQGNIEACIRLGDIYSHCVPSVTDKRFPLSIVQDLNKAYRYYKKAEYYKGMKRVQKQKKR